MLLVLVSLPSTKTVGPCQLNLQFTSKCIIFHICSSFIVLLSYITVVMLSFFGRARAFLVVWVFFFLELKPVYLGEAWVSISLQAGRPGVPSGGRAGPGGQGLSQQGRWGAGQPGAPGAAPALGIRQLPGDGNSPGPGCDVSLWVGSALWGQWPCRPVGNWKPALLQHCQGRERNIFVNFEEILFNPVTYHAVYVEKFCQWFSSFYPFNFLSHIL